MYICIDYRFWYDIYIHFMTWKASWHVKTEEHFVCKDQAINETWWQACHVHLQIASTHLALHLSAVNHQNLKYTRTLTFTYTFMTHGQAHVYSHSCSHSRIICSLWSCEYRILGAKRVMMWRSFAPRHGMSACSTYACETLQWLAPACTKVLTGRRPSFTRNLQ